MTSGSFWLVDDKHLIIEVHDQRLYTLTVKFVHGDGEERALDNEYLVVKVNNQGLPT